MYLQMWSILPCLAHDRATIGVFFNQRIEYKSPYMSKNVRSNMAMFTLQNLIKAPLYKYLNVTIHHQWASLFALHMNLESQIPYNNASFETLILTMKKIHCTPTNSMIHNFFKCSKNMDYEYTIYSIVPSQNLHLLGLFKNKHLEELILPTLFYGQHGQFSKSFSY